MGPHDTGEFWTPTVKGSEMFVQVRHYGVATRADLISTWFVIDEVGHIAEGGVTEVGLGERCYTATCTQNASCGAGILAGSEGAIAHYNFPDGRYIYMCSGGLLADSNPGDEVPLFLTANHCISRGNLARNVDFYFDFQTECGTTCGDNVNAIEVTGGADILSTGKAADYTLMRIKQPVPAGRVFLGWTNAEVAFTDGVGLHRLAHPNGGPMSYSTHTVDTSWGTCSGWARGDRIYSTDTSGNTEGGSSGSPVLNDSGQVVGQLSGACGLDPYADCRPDINATVDGALAAYYGEVAEWLGTGEPECTVDGDCAGLLCCGGQCVAPACSADADCNDGESCTTDTCSGLGCDASCGSSWAACGLADGCCGPACDSSNDVDCPSCGAVGASCDSGAECCSGKCKGKPGSTVCR
jgi:hypothetical protein